MWLLWFVLLLTLFLLGWLLLGASERRLPGGSSDAGETTPGDPFAREGVAVGFDDRQDPLQLEYDREERVARENFERRFARCPQFYYAEGQIRSE